jgi:hypothetical protein
MRGRGAGGQFGGAWPRHRAPRRKPYIAIGGLLGVGDEGERSTGVAGRFPYNDHGSPSFERAISVPTMYRLSM